MKINTLLYAALATSAYAHKDFASAVEYVRNSPAAAVSDENKLKVYGLFKQAEKGDCGEGSLSFSPINIAKRKAWCSNKGMSKETAEELYVQTIDNLVPSWRRV